MQNTLKTPLLSQVITSRPSGENLYGQEFRVFLLKLTKAEKEAICARCHENRLESEDYGVEDVENWEVFEGINLTDRTTAIVGKLFHQLDKALEYFKAI